MRLLNLVWILTVSACALARAADQAAITEPAFDVRAERARREALKRSNQQEEIERMKKAGEPFQTKNVDPKFPPGIPKETYLVRIPVRISIDENGVVRGIRIESPSNPPFDWAVIEAVWQWRFSPKKDVGKAVPFDVLTTVNVARVDAKGSGMAPAPTREAVTPRAP